LYHSWQDHDPSSKLGIQMKWQDVSPLPLILVLATILEDAWQLTWISFCQQSQHPWRMLVPQSTRPQSQFNTEQSNEMMRGHPSPPWFSFWQRYWNGNTPESCFIKRVNTCEECWYHSQQDHDPSLILSNHMKWWDVTPLPLTLFVATILEDARQ
jgi:hypothetical protein